MRDYDRLIFVGTTGACREVMAEAILEEFTLKHPLEILSRGLVVLFPEPLNQKAEAILISNGITHQGFVSSQLQQEDMTDKTMIVTIEKAQKEKLLGLFPEVDPENVFALPEMVGEELDLVDPYGGPLASYGLCYEALRKMIRKLVKLLNDEE